MSFPGLLPMFSSLLTSSEPRPQSNQIYWNQTAVRTHLFDAFSVLLPEGEAFVVEAVTDAAQQLPAASALHPVCAQFAKEEKAHQRAHRNYNEGLSKQGHDVVAMEAGIAKALHALRAKLSVDQRLCLASAFEHITATISAVALRSDRLLANNSSTQARLWRWHCAEEVAHVGVTVDLMAVRRVPYIARVGWFLLASGLMLGDIVRHMRAFYRRDVGMRRVGVTSYWASTLLSTVRALPDLGSAVLGWAAYLLPRRPAQQASTTLPPIVRPLQPRDMPALTALETACWNPEQAAQNFDMLDRMRRHPELCLGAFCQRTGKALASLFMKPTSTQAILRAKTWLDCATFNEMHARDEPHKALFGISLSSTDAAAVNAIFEYFWPHALKGGWRHIYLGSPVPGLAQWLEANPQRNALDYVQQRRWGVPRDPQLRYYHRKGFRRIEAVLPGYFPHARSLDHGVLLRGTVPGSALAPVWRWVPMRVLERVKHGLFKLL